MSFDDEKTTELELPQQPGLFRAPERTPSSNVVRIDFARQTRKAAAAPSRAPAVSPRLVRWLDSVEGWLDGFDFRASWALRLGALLVILLLSLLVL